jgi:hypothetical protein
MLGAIDQALRGMNTGFNRLDKTAVRIARDGAGGDLSGNMTEMMRAAQEVKVNLAVFRTAHETIGSLIDVMA